MTSLIVSHMNSSAGVPGLDAAAVAVVDRPGHLAVADRDVDRRAAADAEAGDHERVGVVLGLERRVGADRGVRRGSARWRSRVAAGSRHVGRRRRRSGEDEGSSRPRRPGEARHAGRTSTRRLRGIARIGSTSGGSDARVDMTSDTATRTSRPRCARRWTARTPRRRASTRTGRRKEKAHGSEVVGGAPKMHRQQGRWRRLLTRPVRAGCVHAVRTQLRGVRGRRDLQALAGQDGHRVRRPPVLPPHDEPPPAPPRRALRRGDDAVRPERRGRQLRLLDPARHVGARTSPARRSPTWRSSRCGTSRRPSTATRSTARRPCSTSGSRRRKDDRGVVHVETIGYNQDGKVVCIFRRKVMVPKDSYLEERGGEQPGRPVPQPDKNWPGAACATRRGRGAGTNAGPAGSAPARAPSARRSRPAASPRRPAR